MTKTMTPESGYVLKKRRGRLVPVAMAIIRWRRRAKKRALASAINLSTRALAASRNEK